MNFFGHAWLAARRRDDAAFVFGAMLPDLAAMARLRVEKVAHPRVEAGRRFHLETDAVFHRSERFLGLVHESTRTLRELGVRPGPARAIGHVGVELLLDGWIAEQHGVPRAYPVALDCGPDLCEGLRLRGRADPTSLARLCRRIREAPVAAAVGCAPERLGARLARILARRPRLALVAPELPAVQRWSLAAREGVAAEGPALLGELGAVAPGGLASCRGDVAASLPHLAAGLRPLEMAR